MTSRPWQIVKLSMERDGLRAQNISLKRELDQVKANLAGQEDNKLQEQRCLDGLRVYKFIHEDVFVLLLPVAVSLLWTRSLSPFPLFSALTSQVCPGI